MFFVVQTAVGMIQTLFSEAETLFFASATLFSVTDNAVGDTPTTFRLSQDQDFPTPTVLGGYTFLWRKIARTSFSIRGLAVHCKYPPVVGPARVPF
jgi:hypothetical protein